MTSQVIHTGWIYKVIVDSNWKRDIDRRISTRRYMFLLFGGILSWMRKRQTMVSLSTVEIKYMVATQACK